jgi:hypothetical protein
LYYIFAIDVDVIALIMKKTPLELRGLLNYHFLAPLFPRADVFEFLGIPVVDGTLATPPVPGTVDRWLLFYTHFAIDRSHPSLSLKLSTYEFAPTRDRMHIVDFLIPSYFYRYTISPQTNMLQMSLRATLETVMINGETLWSALDILEEVVRLGRNALRDSVEILPALGGTDNPSYLINVE